MHRMQMVCGWKKKEHGETASVAVFVRVWEICLKCPCASSSLEGSRSCDGSRPVSSLCSCCSVMLLALKHTNTRLCVNSRHRSTGHPCALAKHCVCFQCPRLASKTAPLPDGGFTGKQAGSVSKINTAGGDATLKDILLVLCEKSVLSKIQLCSAVCFRGGQCLHSPRRPLKVNVLRCADGWSGISKKTKKHTQNQDKS